jgi:glycopeptide antibiotics resistance protein
VSVGELRRSSAASGDEPSRRNRRGLLRVLFATYLALLAWIVVWKLGTPFIGDGGLREVKLVPFVSSACNGASAPSEVIANVVLFLPFGVYLGLIAPTWTWWRTTATIAGASVLAETMQFALAVGASDVTDVVTNTLGGLAGLVVVALVRRRLGTRTLAVVARACAVLTVVALLAVAAFVASPLSFGPQPDVRVSMRSDPGELPGIASGSRLTDQQAREQQCRDERPF